MRPATNIQGGELTRILLTVLVIGGLIAASLWILRPFLGAIIWATMIVVATWPVMIMVQRRLGGRRGEDGGGRRSGAPSVTSTSSR